MSDLAIRIPYIIYDIFDNINGKVPDRDGENIMIVEIKYLLSYAV